MLRYAHAQLILRNAFNSFRRLELGDFDAQAFIFLFLLLHLLLYSYQLIATAGTYAAAYRNQQPQHRHGKK